MYCVNISFLIQITFLFGVVEQYLLYLFDKRCCYIIGGVFPATARPLIG